MEKKILPLALPPPPTPYPNRHKIIKTGPLAGWGGDCHGTKMNWWMWMWIEMRWMWLKTKWMFTMLSKLKDGNKGQGLCRRWQVLPLSLPPFPTPHPNQHKIKARPLAGAGWLTWDECRNPPLKECEDEIHVPKMGTWESFGTPKTLEFNYRGQNTLHWGVLYIIRKLSKCKCRKWACMGQLDICSTTYGKKKGWELN